MGNAGSGQQRDRHKSGELPPSSPGKEGTAFVFDKTPNKFLYQSSREEEEEGYGVHKISQDSKDEFVPVCIRAQGECDTPGETSKALPTVFKWEGGGKQVYISGTFSNWKTIPMVKSHGDFVTIVDLPEGDHQYKFLVDGDWVHNPSEPIVDNSMGSKNNVIKVKQTDFEVFDALAIDSMTTGNTCQAGSPPGDYNQEIPMHRPQEKVTNPPILPPHLLQVILNKDTPLSCEPTLLPEPNHVMLNHLYALSIKDGVMVLSATHRYRKKYVTTLLYKPI